MSYLSQHFIEFCDQCSDQIAFDTTIDEILLNESYYMAPRRYNTRRRVAQQSRVDDTSVRNEEKVSKAALNSKDSAKRGEKEVLNSQYNAKRREKLTQNTDSSEEEEQKNSSSEKGPKLDEHKETDDEFLDDEDIRGLESQLQLDLTSTLKKNVYSNQRKTLKVSQVRENELSKVETMEKPTKRKAEVPEAGDSDRLKRKAEIYLDVVEDGPVTYSLTNWFPLFTSKGTVFVEGVCVADSSGLTEANERKNSSSIVKRIDSCTLCSKSGNIYKLKGQIDSQMASESGVSDKIIKKFRNGFPKRWQEWIAEHSCLIVLGRSDVSLRSSNDNKDISSFKSNTDKQKVASSKSEEKDTKKYKKEDTNKMTTKPRSIVSPQHDPKKPRIDVEGLPRTRSGRIVIPRLEFWRQERLLTLRNMTLLISVNPSEGKNVHNSTILNETFSKPSEKLIEPNNSSLIKPIFSLRKQVTKMTKPAKMEKVEEKEVKNDDEYGTTPSTTRARGTLKSVSVVKPIVSKATKKVPNVFVELPSSRVLPGRKVGNNGCEGKTTSSKVLLQKVTTNPTQGNTDYKVTAKPGTLLFKSQMRNFLLLNSQSNDDDDNFTNSTPYRAKKRFKLHGLRLDDEDDDYKSDDSIRTPQVSIPYLNPASEKKTPTAYRCTVTPHSRNVDRKMIDRYIRNRKRNPNGKRKSSSMISTNYQTPHQPLKTQSNEIDSNCFRSLALHLRSVQDDDDDDDDDEEELDYYFSDDSSK